MLIKKLTLAIAVTTFVAGAALAQTAPKAPVEPAAPAVQAPASAAESELKDGELKLTADAETCLKTAADLAAVAEERKITDDKIDKIDDLLVKMETHCDARQFSDAHKIANDVKTLIQAR